MEEFHSFYFDSMNKEPVTDDFVVPRGTEMTPELLGELIDDHRRNHVPRYRQLKWAYENKCKIFTYPKKDPWKPDNRLGVPLPKYICDTFNGYFIGNPVDYRSANDDAQVWVRRYNVRNGQEDVDAELSKACSKFGKCCEHFYRDGEGKPRSTWLTPLCCFMVYDDTAEKLPMYGAFYAYDEDGNLTGFFEDAQNQTAFSQRTAGVIEFEEPEPHYFAELPWVEYVENSEKTGVYEGVMNLIDAYNKGLSEKGNDVEYFGDSYLALLGADLDEDDVKVIRENRVINFSGPDSEKLQAFFLSKPDSDNLQEHFLDRLEELIFKTSMVVDVSKDNLGTSSGVAIQYRMKPMSDLAKTKERKFVAAIRRRLRILEGFPNTPLKDGDYLDFEIAMHRNMPADIQSEAQTAAALSGIVSEETQLSVLSIVQDPESEIERKDREQEKLATALGYPTNRTEVPDEGGGNVPSRA